MILTSLAHIIPPLLLQYLWLAVFVDFLIMILTPLAPPALLLDSRVSAQCLMVDLCICFRQFLDVGSMITTSVVTNLIIGEGQFR